LQLDLGEKSDSKRSSFVCRNCFYKRELSRKAFESLKRPFCPAGGGSQALRACEIGISFQFFPVPLCGTMKQVFTNPALFPPKAEWPKATNRKR